MKYIFKLFWTFLTQFLEKFENENIAFDTPELKIALVKQDVYADLYKINSPNKLEIIASSNHRSGPMGLFTDFVTDFFVIGVQDDEICKIYLEKGYNNSWDLISKGQQKLSVDPYDVDWGKYDLVLAIENAVPRDIITKYKHVTWATMVEYHRMKSYKNYMLFPPDGYDLFFNQRFGPTPLSIFKKKHVIEFPYAFNSSGKISRMLKISKKQNIAVIEGHSLDVQSFDLLKYNGFNVLNTNVDRNIIEHLRLLCKSKIILLPIEKSERMLWGNITLEAAACDSLIIGNKLHLWNSHLIVSECNVNSINQLKKLLKSLNNEEFYQTLLDKQRKKLDYYGFIRPLKQLSKTKKLHKKFAKP